MAFVVAIFMAFIVGFYTPKLPIPAKLVNKALHHMVILILCVMGYRVGVDINNYDGEFLGLLISVAVLSFALLIVTSMLVHWLFSRSERTPQPLKKTSNNKALFESCMYLGLTAAGVFIGYLVAVESPIFAISTTIMLLMILFFVAQDMRAQGFSLASIVTNREGMLLAAAVVVSAMATSLIMVMALDLEPGVALALTSGYSWYTLSGPLISDLISPYAGAQVFFVDLLREVLALALIPLLSRMSFFVPIGYSGASAFDFTLPMLRENLGAEVVPIAVTSATILSLLAPGLLSLGAFLAG